MLQITPVTAFLTQTIIDALKEHGCSTIVLCIPTRSPCVVDSIWPFLNVVPQHEKTIWGSAVGVAFIDEATQLLLAKMYLILVYTLALVYGCFKQRHPTTFIDRYP